jgi:C4-dicarboxylate transporter DctQ subunit
VEKAYAAWRAFQDKVLAHVSSLLLLGMTLLALLEVVRRYVFGQSFEWQQDAVTFITLSGVFLYFSLAQRRGAHLNVTIVTDSLQALGPGARRAAALIRLFALAFSFLFLLAVLWWGLPEVRESIHYETRTESLAFPMWPFLAALYLGFAFMAVTMFFQIYRDVHKLRGRTVLDDPEQAGESAH